MVGPVFLPFSPRDGGPVSASVCERRATADLAVGQIEDPLWRTRPLTFLFLLKRYSNIKIWNKYINTLIPHQERFAGMVADDGRTHGEKEGKFSMTEVVEVRDPKDAQNERGNPEVRVDVYQSNGKREQYIFEFVRPSEDEEYPIYRYGTYNVTGGANMAKNRNKAHFKAAEALAEHTGTPVEALVKPTDDLDENFDLSKK